MSLVYRAIFISPRSGPTPPSESTLSRAGLDKVGLRLDTLFTTSFILEALCIQISNSQNMNVVSGEGNGDDWDPFVGNGAPRMRCISTCLWSRPSNDMPMQQLVYFTKLFLGDISRS